MLKKDNIKDILAAVKADWQDVSESDIAFLVLCDTFDDKRTAHRLAYGRECRDVEAFCQKEGMRRLQEALRPFGIGADLRDTVSREQNKAELMQLLGKIKQAVHNGELEIRDALKMEADIRVKLNDKFDMDEGDRGRRIIVVPQKHDIICPHTHRECTYMPTKEACMKHYKLKEGK